MENVITLGKLIGLLFCLPILFSINVHTKNTRNELTRLVKGTIFLVIIIHDEEIARISHFCQSAEMDFHCLAGPLNASIDFKCDVL